MTITVTATGSHARPLRREDPRQLMLAGLVAAGEAAGRDAATWWARHVLWGPPSQARLAALLTLDGIDARDPDLLDTLPSLPVSGPCDGLPTDAGHHPPAVSAAVWSGLDEASRSRAVAGYRASHDTALLAEVSKRCLALLRPAAAAPATGPAPRAA